MLSLSPRRTAVLSCGALVAMAAWLRAGAPLPGSSPDAPGRAATAATTELREAIESEAAALRAIASAALDRVGGSPASAFDALTGLVADNPRRSVAATRDGLVSAWGGRYLGPTDSLSGPIGVVGNEFHLVLYAVVIRDSDRAVASSLIHAAPPGDGLARGLDIAIVENGDVAGFTFGSPGAPLPEGAQLATVGDTPVIGVRATPLEPAAYAARQAERRQLWGGFLLALAAVVVLVRIWRRAQARGRVGVLAMVVVLVAIVPLSAYSNASVLFSPAVFYVAEGGPLSGSIAAVALVAATLLAGVLAAYRADALPRARIWSVVTIGIVAVVAPFVITAVARGIRYPADGASPLLWIAWETAVFLTATLALVTMIAVGGARTADRGLPPWVAVLLAAGATAVAPMVVTARGGLPTWYAVVWAVAIVAVAVSRRGAARIGAAAAVAAFGAAAVTWSETVKARVVLAELDVSSLSVADSGTSALLRRFPLQLDSNSAARSRAELMAQFAASELASSNHPIDLTTWSPGGAAVMVDLRVGLGPGTARGVEYFARMAAETRQPVLTHVPGEQSMLTVLALPHVDGTVTTAVLSPRTRLVAPDPFPTITGLAPRRGGGEDPPYTLQASPADLTQYVSSEAAWTRRNDEIHGDWFLPSGAQVLHVHARVPLSTYGALATRGALLVFANLALFGAVWLLLVVADGGARRPLLDATTTWLRSYRARLTVSLFGAFVLPAAAFTTWSYTRLRDDDARARDVLVGETLRGVLASPSTGIDSLAARFDAPLFLFANGVLVASSDPLFDALAPIGRLLPAEAAAALLQDDDGFATADLVVGGAPMRFGFRAIADSGNGGRLVLGVPARTAGLALDQQRTDLVYLGAVITISGALLALWLSGIAARALSRPIGDLRDAAVALAGGVREPPLRGDPPPEFSPVFGAFRDMAHELEVARTREAQAQRVLAWGEMARQVAHEIKNPLTPMRLGVQHLIRAKDDPRVDFRAVFDANAARILEEIGRLDEIARSFSRYGTAPDAAPAAERVDVSAAVRDVVHLEEIAGGTVSWASAGIDAPVWAMARPTELREVLLNLLENSRLAESHRVTVSVTVEGSAVRVAVMDDGCGMPPDVLPRVFEPHFSTRTSGSGLGLAISRRLIEGWGGTIAAESTPGQGTTITISLVGAAAE